MWKNGLLILIVLLTSFKLKAQKENSYSVSSHHDFNKLIFLLNATNGHCHIKPGGDDNVINIHSKTSGTASPQYEEKNIDGVKLLHVKLQEENSNYLSSTFSNQLINFRTPDEHDHIWNVSISKLKPVEINLNYAIGDSYIDLTGLSIERLKVRTGSANIVVNYKNDVANFVKMDTFLIKVDIGSFEAKNLHLSRSENIIADVGFGNVKMDFGNAEFINTDVRATIGAGKLIIVLPANDIPIKININDSPLCHIKLPKGYVNSTAHIFHSPEYGNDQSNSINFDVDVAVGSIVFKTAKR